ncbi:MAG: 2-dehydropantoate 2-reductase [Polyangiaceae bacterium]|nr:2-dehydropantoate 2-reductase [Polyangiaceae bacterium]
MRDSLAPRFLVMGCGAIGGVLTESLAAKGYDVTACTTNAAIHARIAECGLTVLGHGMGKRASRTARAVVVLGAPAAPTEPASMFDYVLLATQPPQVEQAAASAFASLKDDGAMICLQNGLCEERVAKIVGEHRVIGGVVGWGATMPEPGVYECTAPGGFTLGQISDALLDARHNRLVRALEAVGPVEVTRNLRGKRWSKLAINCAISSLGTLGGDRLGVLMQHRIVRRLGLQIMTEVVEVARNEGVELEKVSGTIDLPWVALTEREKLSNTLSLVAKHALLLAVGFRFRRMKSSMLSAIERGRTPAVDFLNGEVVTRARAAGIRVPANTVVRDAVWDIAKGRKRAGLGLLREVYALSSQG